MSIIDSYYEKSKKIRENQELKKRIKNIDKGIVKTKSGISTINKWIKFYKNIKEQVEKVQNLSISNYAESFGPAASKIQNKLRRIHGFGKLKLIPKGKGIFLKIENQFLSTFEEEMLSPNEYLSASQMQLIALSIFLSAAISQTWSNFATILLDDPVQHFDDLNCHNFADLIRNLISDDDECPYQFIISTCDEMFFKTLQSKLPPNKVKVYRFQEIDENGPVVHPI